MNLKLLYLFLTISLGGYSQVIELPYEEKEGWPIIQVNIDNKDYDFLFDTGAAMTFLNSNSFPNAVKMGELEVRDLNGIVDNISTTMLPELFLMHQKFYNKQVALKDLQTLNKWLCDVKLDGILGIDILQNHLVEFDTENQIIKFYDKATFDKSLLNGFTKNTYSHTLPTLKLKIDKQTRYATFDTGSNGGLNISDYKLGNFIDENKHLIYKGLGGQAANSLREDVNQTELIDVNIKFGKIDLNHQNFTLNTHNENNVGFQFLKRFIFFLDVSDQIIYLKKRSDLNTTLSPLVTYGFWVHYDFEMTQFYVASIAENNKQLQLKDIVTKINGIDLPQEYCDLRDFLSQNMQVDMSVTIFRDGNEKIIDYNYDNQISQ
ncbi:hypothetical protein [Leeuwenhoekiella sp. H156]|uniref:hypothetical protein n=1 Tax=Leeuwenhoekiella sp. H156 TaxID=3450128 RepID=UPI003FA4B6B3